MVMDVQNKESQPPVEIVEVMYMESGKCKQLDGAASATIKSSCRNVH